jgi:uncharacterized protein YbjQ (UPF0145 family)
MTTQDKFEEYEVVRTLGIVRGNTIRAKNIGQDFVAGLRNIVGGEIDEYTKMFAESREQATDRMIAHAQSIGANGIVGIRYTTSAVAQGAAELMAYGTAVVLAAKGAGQGAAAQDDAAQSNE